MKDSYPMGWTALRPVDLTKARQYLPTKLERLVPIIHILNFDLRIWNLESHATQSCIQSSKSVSNHVLKDMVRSC